MIKIEEFKNLRQKKKVDNTRIRLQEEEKEEVFISINNILAAAKNEIMKRYGISYSDIEYIGNMEKLKFSIPKVKTEMVDFEIETQLTTDKRIRFSPPAEIKKILRPRQKIKLFVKMRVSENEE